MVGNPILSRLGGHVSSFWQDSIAQSWLQRRPSSKVSWTPAAIAAVMRKV
jgi:hypothetical protein